MVKTLFWIVLGVLIGTFIATVVFAADVTLSWEKPNDARVTGYHIFYGTDQQAFQTPKITVDNAAQTSVLITGLEDGRTYDFGATATGDNGSESEMSEIISYFVLPYKPAKLILRIGE